MKLVIKYSVVFLLFVLPICSQAQENEGKQLVAAVLKKIQTVNDYSVEVNIRLDMPFIRMLPVDAKIYYKQKNKFKVESKSIAPIPKNGFEQLNKLFEDINQYTIVLQGVENVDGIATKVVNLIPLSDTSDIILGRLWIEPVQNVLQKLQLTTRSNGTIVTNYTYGSQVAYGLPDKLTFTVDVKKIKLPKVMGADLQETKKDDKPIDNSKGKIFVKLTNYKVNKGISDTFFAK